MHLFNLAIFACFAAIVYAGPTKISDGRRQIKLSEEDPGQWVTQDQLYELRKQGIHFLDITDLPVPNRADLPIRTRDIPDSVKHQATVNPLISNLNIQRSRTFIEFFSGFYTRMYNTEMGKVAALWLKAEVQTYIDNSQYQGQASVDFFVGSSGL